MNGGKNNVGLIKMKKLLKILEKLFLYFIGTILFIIAFVVILVMAAIIFQFGP